MTEEQKKKSATSELHSTIAQLAQALENGEQHMVLRTEEKVIGAFYPSDQADWLAHFRSRTTEIEKRLVHLEEKLRRIQSELVASEEKEDSPPKT